MSDTTLRSADPDCQLCKGTGWEVLPMHSVERRIWRTGDGMGSYVCRCRRVQPATLGEKAPG